MEGQDLMIQTIVEGLQDNKAKKIIVADMSNIEEAAFKNFIICEGTSTTQVNSIGEKTIDYIKGKTGRKPYAYDGFKNCQWIVVDYGDTLLHIFLPEFREFYKLEQLWADAKLTQVPDLE